MPFVARDAVTKARIDITQYRNPRAELQAQQLICQLGDARMLIRQGLVVRPHFAHVHACPETWEAHPESVEHLAAKEALRAWLQGQPGFEDTRIDLEVPIYARKRIADVMVTFPEGHRLAVEIQLASITTEQLEARTYDYFNDGVDVLWVLGGQAAASPHNQQWCRQTLGGYLRISFTEDTRVDTVQLPRGWAAHDAAPAVADPTPGRPGVW